MFGSVICVYIREIAQANDVCLSMHLERSTQKKKLVAVVVEVIRLYNTISRYVLNDYHYKKSRNAP